MPDRIDISATNSHAQTDVVATVVVEAMPAIALLCAAAIIEFLDWRTGVFMVVKKSKCGACDHRSRVKQRPTKHQSIRIADYEMGCLQREVLLKLVNIVSAKSVAVKRYARRKTRLRFACIALPRVSALYGKLPMVKRLSALRRCECRKLLLPKKAFEE